MTQKPPGPKGMYCPDWKKDMSKVCQTCPLWIKVLGKNPQSEETVDRWDCAKAWMPMLLIENSQMQRQTAAAVESFRNVNAESMQNLAGAVIGGMRVAADQIAAERERSIGVMQGAVTALISGRQN